MESWNKKLFTAAEDGDLEALRLCLQNAADVDYQDGTGWTPLMRAAFRGHLEITRLLLSSGCKIDSTNSFGWTAFMIAAIQGYLEITRLIHDSGCTTDIKDNNGITALHLAAEGGHLEVTRYLIEQACVSPLDKTPENKTPYELATASHANKEILEYLQTAMSKYAQDVKTKTSGNIQEMELNEDNIPTEIKSMTDKKSVALYLKLLESGSEKKTDIRLVFVGEKGAGKTSLINRLFDKDITDITSTNGIEIHTVKCKANSDDGLWIKLQGNNEETEIHGRLLKPYTESIQDKETAEPVAAGTNPPGITASEEGALRISPSNVRPQGITTSNENPEGTIEQSHKSLEQAKMDIETMLTDRSKVDFQDKEEYATLLLWDFAGDEEFYHTHQTFLSSEAIYLVFAKLDDAHDEKAHGYISFISTIL